MHQKKSKSKDDHQASHITPVLKEIRLLTRCMPTRETFVSFLNDTLISSAQNIPSDSIKHLHMLSTGYMLTERTMQGQSIS